MAFSLSLSGKRISAPARNECVSWKFLGSEMGVTANGEGNPVMPRSATFCGSTSIDRCDDQNSRT